MPGFADYLAEPSVDFITGRAPMPAIGNRFLALFTAAPTNDAGTGGTEVSGGAYARQQVAGAVAATASFTTASPNVTMTANPGWVVPGMNVYDLTNSQQIGTVLTYSGTALVLTGNAAHASSGSTDSLQFSAWPAASASSGSEPAVTPAQATNGAVISFAQATANWGTVDAFGIYDAVTSGNLLTWDYLGNYAWQPATINAASPGVITCHAHGLTSSTPFVVSTKFSGTLPSFSTGNLTGVITPASVTTDTITLSGINTSTTGDFNLRQIVQQSIPTNVTASFAASQFPVAVA